MGTPEELWCMFKSEVAGIEVDVYAYGYRLDGDVFSTDVEVEVKGVGMMNIDNYYVNDDGIFHSEHERLLDEARTALIDFGESGSDNNCKNE